MGTADSYAQKLMLDSKFPAGRARLLPSRNLSFSWRISRFRSGRAQRPQSNTLSANNLRRSRPSRPREFP